MKILVLSTWFPYPMTEGGKTRAYYLIRALANNHEVALISFAPAGITAEAESEMRRFCKRIDMVERDPFAFDRKDTLRGWFSKYPSSVLSSYSSEMSSTVRRVALDSKPDAVLALTFVTAPYPLELPDVRRILVRENCVSNMLLEAHRGARGLLARTRTWLAWKKFRRYEIDLLMRFDLSPAASRRDQNLFVDMCPAAFGKVPVVPNGVDTSWFRITGESPTPNTLVFNGALTYGPNFDAMEYFLREVFPLVIAKVPDVHLRITGATESVPIDRLCVNDAVTFTGFVKDIRPILEDSWASVAPLRAGGGTRLKILEAMAAGTPVVSTSKGAEGLDVEDGIHLLIADTPETFAARIVSLLSDPGLRERLVRKARLLVEQKYDWTAIGEQFTALIHDTVKASMC